MSARRAGACSGQMAVELAVLVPACIAVALVVFNLGRFLVACAEFDRVALDAAVAHGVSPSGSGGLLAGAAEVRSAIEDAFSDTAGASVDVSAEELGVEDGAIFSLGPALVRYRCTLRLRTWPTVFSFAGVWLGTPFSLVHERSIVVDRYCPGVVV